MSTALTKASASAAPLQEKLELLTELERKVLWLSTWTIQHANHLRNSRDGLKVGGHQASSASMTALMTALYFDVLRSEERRVGKECRCRWATCHGEKKDEK